jgi:predicted  nucleic acid-binding Zn-ribbon protein
MTTFARLDSLSGLVRDLIELTAEQYAALDGNPKQALLRPLVIDAQPTPSATQAIVNAGYVVEPTQVRQTWALRDKTADELEVEAIDAAKDGYQAHIDALNVQLDITNAMRGAMTTNQRLNTLEADTRATMKAVKDLLRQAKRAM